MWKYSQRESFVCNNSFCPKILKKKKKKNGEKYLITDSTDKYEEVKSEIKTFNGEKELFYEKNCARIGVNTDDDLPLNEPLRFQTLTVIIRCIFQEGRNLYSQICLDEYLYEL